MTMLIFVSLLQWFEAVIANVMIKPYEIGLWPLGDFNTTVKQWWTDDESKMLHLPNTDVAIAFFVGGFIKWHYILSVTTILLFMSIERSFACYFLNDYEKKSRNGLLMCLVFGSQGTIFVATLTFFYNASHFALGMLIILTPNMIALALFQYTRSFNQKVTRSIEDFSNPQNYSLAARFQAKENIRCFHLMSNVVTGAFMFILTACSLNLVIFLEWVPALDTLFNMLFENMISLNTLFLCPTLLQSVDVWRKFSVLNRLRSSLKNHRTTKVSTVSECAGRIDVTNKETDAYFDQLNAAWT
uniref:Serpentine receptor class gamma n=1 Tax=Caenorhabditis japonica TaxID=281687 RepID=A0A8R1DN47_CAEJA